MTDQRGDRGQQYDAVMREIAERDARTVFRLLGLPVPENPQVLPASFPSSTPTVDLLVLIAPGRLAHVEYQHVGEPDFVARMLVYRGLIQRAYPGHHLSQHVVVLRDRPISGHDDLEANGFALDLQILYLRDIAPEVLLASPRLLPLAVLGRGTREERRQVLVHAVRALDALDDRTRAELLRQTLILATIRLDALTIERTLREGDVAQDIAMEIMENVWGETARRQLRETVRLEVLTELLHDRFGASAEADELARRLAGWTTAEAVHAVNAATDLADLRTRVE